MKAARHSLVASLLGAISIAASARAGLASAIPAKDIGLDGLWKTGYRGSGGSLRNGSIKVRRAARKARNVRANRRNHRG